MGHHFKKRIDILLLPRRLPVLLQPVGFIDDFGVLGIPGNPIAAELPPDRERDVRNRCDGVASRLLQKWLCYPAEVLNDAEILALRASIHGPPGKLKIPCSRGP
ncbi:MAG: hypothetical protein ACK6D3_08545 [Planctomycetaceae bacterium]